MSGNFSLAINRHGTRRQFVKAAATGLLAAALPSNDHAEAGPRIIDTHTHFYDPTRPQGVPWPPPDDRLLYRRVLPVDYLVLPKPHPVAGTVVVEASPWLEDNQWVLDLAEREPFIVGFVGNLPIGTDAFEGNLKRFAANRLFRGIRIGGDKLKRPDDETFRRHLSLLAEHDLALDLLGGPDMLPDVPALAKAFPGLRMVIDHVANLAINGKTPPTDWAEGMKAAGAHQNVFCKVSGLVEGTGRTGGDAPTEERYYRPVLDTIWDAFGAERLVYGSNWPVSERFASCASVQEIVMRYFARKRDGVAAQVLGENSRKLYHCAPR